MASARRMVEVQSEAEVRRMSARATADFVDAPTITDRMIQRLVQRVGDESQRVDEVALPGTVRTDEERQRPETNVAGADAAVVLQPDAVQERRRRHDRRLPHAHFAAIPAPPNREHPKPSARVAVVLSPVTVWGSTPSR